jgi:ABC-type transporter Mla subunit MlaD
MKGRTVWLLAIGIILLLVVVIAVGLYLMTGGRTYSSDLNSLRAQFNKDKGKVRVLLLLSPT